MMKRDKYTRESREAIFGFLSVAWINVFTVSSGGEMKSTFFCTVSCTLSEMVIYLEMEGRMVDLSSELLILDVLLQSILNFILTRVSEIEEFLSFGDFGTVLTGQDAIVSRR